ncbi:general transcription factor II-I repeat domain-containing protein 2B-like [Pomacea canaliculata]|uniref:general transcription factor II-I repeat domain-containing protein 2B-like n=1 Tax=Pomacea canaliculata TaxID=400727 RepID=UPI000D739527|nr:general transcription factor II-I repeat domain-containing protein 2B-like [Pomacea canaliculata]
MATHGAKSFTGKNIGMVKLLKDKLTTENPGSDILSFHCILHQESLCKSALDIKHVIELVISVVNIIKSKALNHRQLKSLLEDLEAEYEDVLYHNNVGWLSLAKVLKRVWALREEIIVFLDMKEISCEFKTKMGVKSGGKQKMPGNIATKVKSYLKSLEEEMERRFQDFSNTEPEFNILAYPFTADPGAAPDELQLELMDLQSDPAMKEAFNSAKLVDFYKSLSADNFPHLRKFAMKMFSLFGSTYICEQSFSCMKINKNKYRGLLTDTNLEAVLRISTSNLNPDFKWIVKNCDRVHLSH